MDAERRGWHQPAIEPGGRDCTLAIENTNSEARYHAALFDCNHSSFSKSAALVDMSVVYDPVSFTASLAFPASG